MQSILFDWRERMKISVLICTRNRANSLGATLERFFEQSFRSDYDYELIIVDNDSTDHTRQVVTDCACRHPGLVEYIHEPRRGLCYARNTSIAAGKGDLIV